MDDDRYEIAEILDAMSVLMTDLHEADLQLQDAFSAMAVRVRSVKDVDKFQHIDLLTQTHRDLAHLLADIADTISSESFDRERLKSSLTLQSLQDALFKSKNTDAPAKHMPGEVSLF